MGRYSAGVRATAGTIARPMMSVFGAASNGFRLVEVGVINTVGTAVSILLSRFTAVGTAGAGLTESAWDPTVPAICTAFTTHTGDATLGDDLGFRTILAAVVGAGVVWTFGKNGIASPVGTANGIGPILATGTGQVCDCWMVWDE